MPLVQLSRLRSQVNALLAHFNNVDEFCDSLTSLFLMYENKESSTNIWLRKNLESVSYNVPESVMSELESRIVILSRKMPEAALVNADRLWEMPYFESKKTAIALVSNLGDAYQDDFLQRIHSWLAADLEENLTTDLLSAVEVNPAILHSKQWLDLLKSLIDTNEIKNIKLALQALNRTLRHKYQNLPAIYSLLTPLVRNPQITIQKDLKSIFQTLIVQSQAEIASFFIMMGNLYPADEVLFFLRKCLPLFDDYFQAEIRNAISRND